MSSSVDDYKAKYEELQKQYAELLTKHNEVMDTVQIKATELSIIWAQHKWQPGKQQAG